MAARIPSHHCAWLALAAALASVPAIAQDEAGASDTAAVSSAASEVYTPADFTRFAPRTALDLIERIPGFSVDRSGGDGGGRGFGQASENLLINGERLSSKSTSTADQLARISVDAVVRIEIVDGASLDIPGLTGRVANIIVEQQGATGQFRWRPEWNTGTAPAQWFEGELSLTGSTLGVDYTVALENRDFARGRLGPNIFTFADGTVDERINRASNLFNRPNLSALLAFSPAPDMAVNLNLSGGIEIFDSEEAESRIANSPLGPFAESFVTDSDEWFYELGGDVTFPVGPGSLKLIVLESYDYRERRDSSLLDTAGLPTSGSQFIRIAEDGERIGRGEYSWGMLGADWQLSAEAAFNRLDQSGRLFGYDPARSDYVEVAFPGGAANVREDRYEALLSVGFPLAANLTLQLIGGAEYSDIRQTGDNARSRSFTRPKGSLNLAWAPVSGLDVNFEVARRVGQLDFGDFLASVDLSDEQENAGNSDLRPQQNWDVTLEIAKNLGAWGSATLTLFDEQIDDLILVLPLDNGGEARGNIDSSRRTGINFLGTFQLAAMGFEGAQLDVEIDWETSSVVDPVTAVERRFDGNEPFELALDFRHDVPRTDIAWGWGFLASERYPFFRTRQEIREHGPSTSASVFVEHKDVFGATANLRLGNLIDDEDVLFRTVYDGLRGSSPVRFTEDRRRDLGQTITLTLTGSF